MKRIVMVACALALFGTPARAGDSPAVRGRTAFVELQCHSCHRVAEDDFLPASKHANGPLLERMGEWTVEQLKERIVSLTENDPEAIYDSPMTECASAMTMQQLDDVVAYLRNPASARTH